MNFFLLMYLNFFRGPRLAAEKAEQEERERLAQEEEDRKNGVVRVEPTCKKCDAKIDRKLTRRVNPTNPLCHECQAKELAEKQAQFDQMQADLKMTPFLWFQCFMLLLGLSAFIHRNVFAFF